MKGILNNRSPIVLILSSHPPSIFLLNTMMNNKGIPANKEYTIKYKHALIDSI